MLRRTTTREKRMGVRQCRRCSYYLFSVVGLIFYTLIKLEKLKKCSGIKVYLLIKCPIIFSVAIIHSLNLFKLKSINQVNKFYLFLN